MHAIQLFQVTGPQAGAFSVGLLLARLVFGLAFAAHGAQKLFGWFGGYGLAGTGGFFEQLGFRPGRLFAFAASASEVAAGLLITLGLAGPVAATLTVAVMFVAATTVHRGKGFFSATGGFEGTLLYATAAVVLAFTGPGTFSLDAALGLDALWSPAGAASATAVGILGGLGALGLRRPTQAVSQASTAA
jgi:putative oxidoreductase